MYVSTLGSASEIYRVRDWLPVMGMVFLGWLSTSTNPSALILSGAAAAFLLAFSGAFNDYFDARKGGEENPVWMVGRERWWAAPVLVLLPLLAVSLLLYVLPAVPVIAALAFLVVNVLYSAPPFRFTERPFLSLLMNAGGGPLLIVVGVHGSPTPYTLFLVVAYAWYFLVSEVIHQFDDFQEDVDAQTSTVVQVMGRDLMRQVLLAGLAAGVTVALGTALAIPELRAFLAVFAPANALRFLRFSSVPVEGLGGYRNRLWGKTEGVVYLVLLAVLSAGVPILPAAGIP